MTTPAAEHAGDQRHPDHPEFLRELGAAVYAASSLAGIVTDMLRVHLREDYFDLVDLPLGRLLEHVDAFAGIGSPVPSLTAWLEDLRSALVVRNDLLHALPVLHGLHRRTGKDRARVVNFFDLEDLTQARETLERVSRQGNRLLYFDGGTRVDLWSQGA